MQTLTTNEWLRADIQKPWKDDGRRLTETIAHHITHVYIYTKDTETTLP